MLPHFSLILHLIYISMVPQIVLAAALLHGRARALSLWHGDALSNRNPVYADRKRIKNMASFSVTEGKLCGALRRRSESSSVYPLITITMRRPVILPSLVSIARKLREEFANMGFELYQNIYRGVCVCMCIIVCILYIMEPIISICGRRI